MQYTALCQKIDELQASGDTEDLLRYVRMLAYRRLYDEDAAQTVTIRVFQRISHYEPIAPFHAWVNHIIRGVRADMFKAMEEANRSIPLPDELYAGNDRHPEIQFPSEQARQVFELKAEGFSPSEIATALGVSRNTLDQRCHRWKKQIKLKAT
ncbi:sigma-70 family RNA polymerase sigma factor [Occallatibacter riparius]|uniref:RNA polymerase sigma factor n=1 Tax=Occallatibacter riparius TaxID=1002689 RepID=A0A9J7BKP4_9BACT|nr:RNA polymerase sigma factor [Occallatibacter riparius]UWZ81837.1 RNA polymerase sigma factor [Occallatibacter riparius]